MTEMSFVMLAGTAANQKALANKFHGNVKLKGIVLSKNISKQRKSFSGKISSIKMALLTRTVGSVFRDAWSALMADYNHKYPEWPECKQIYVDNINAPETLTFLKEHSPDYILVSGTNLIGKNIIEWASANTKGILNLHTGISPYIKGGPNCTNWCLATGQFSFIGNTIMKLDAGIDTGAIITTERTNITGMESLSELHQKVMDHAHDLYVKVVRVLAEGKEVQSVPQKELGDGKTFYTKDWDAGAMLSAQLNFKSKFPRASLQAAPEMKLVDLKTQ